MLRTKNQVFTPPNLNTVDTVLQYNTIREKFIAQPTTKPERLGITMLINDKSSLKRNVEQIGFQLALKKSKSLS